MLGEKLGNWENHRKSFLPKLFLLFFGTGSGAASFLGEQSFAALNYRPAMRLICKICSICQDFE